MMDDVSIINSNEHVDEENNKLNYSIVQIQKKQYILHKIQCIITALSINFV